MRSYFYVYEKPIHKKRNGGGEVVYHHAFLTSKDRSKLHSPAFLPPGTKSPDMASDRRTRGSHSPFGCSGEQKTLFINN
jgi:hypothetical protein